MLIQVFCLLIYKILIEQMKIPHITKKQYWMELVIIELHY